MRSKNRSSLGGWSASSLAATALLAMLILLSPERGLAGDSLIWAVANFPPFQVIEGPYKGSGSFDGELQTLIASMPEFEHQIVPMSFARRREEFRSGTNLCTPGIFRAPAEALKLAISIPALTHLDNRVIFLKDKAAKFGTEDTIDLDSLFGRQAVVGGMVQGRSYAPNIDEAIQRFFGNRHLIIRPMDTAQLFQLLLSGEIDYLLLFSHEAAFLADRFGAVGRIESRPIAGTPPYIYTHVACTGNAWGRAVIDKINAVLLAERGKPEYRSLSERWYPPIDQARVRRHYPNMLKELN
jgi:uncharacterized protein (TIGR02285 family)